MKKNPEINFGEGIEETPPKDILKKINTAQNKVSDKIDEATAFLPDAKQPEANPAYLTIAKKAIEGSIQPEKTPGQPPLSPEQIAEFFQPPNPDYLKNLGNPDITIA